MRIKEQRARVCLQAQGPLAAQAQAWGVGRLLEPQGFESPGQGGATQVSNLESLLPKTPRAHTGVP